MERYGADWTYDTLKRCRFFYQSYANASIGATPLPQFNILISHFCKSRLQNYKRTKFCKWRLQKIRKHQFCKCRLLPLLVCCFVRPRVMSKFGSLSVDLANIQIIQAMFGKLKNRQKYTIYICRVSETRLCLLFL